MKKLWSFPILVLLFCCNLSGQETPRYAAGQLLVKFLPETAPASEQAVAEDRFQDPVLDALGQKYGWPDIRKIGPLAPRKKQPANDWQRTFLLQAGAEVDLDQMLADYEQTGLFEFVERNYGGSSAGSPVELTPDDPFYGRQWSHYNDGTFFLGTPVIDADIDLDEAWEVETGDPSIIVAVLDNGVNYNHPEFQGRIWNNAGEIPNNGIDDDSDGYTDDVLGWDFAYTDNDPDDAYGHGTNVAGIATASGNNGIGYAGVDWNCTLMPLKILDDNDFGFYTWWAEAIYFAVDHGARVLNMSVGGSGFSSTLEDAVDYAHLNGTTVVVSMMNTNSNTPYYPAAYQSTIAVGSTSPDDTRTVPFPWSASSGSNYGAHIDVVAPGNYMYGLHYLNNNNYDTYWAGTSQATPLVTGLCALLLAQDPSLGPEDLRTILHDTAEDQVGLPSEDTPGFDIYYGYGRINALEALSPTIQSTSDRQWEEMKLFPNPLPSGQKVVSVQLPDNDSGEYLLSLSTADGRLIRQSRQALFGTTEVEVGALAPGTYFLQIEQGARRFRAALAVH